MTGEDDIEMIETLRKLLTALRRTGIIFAALALIAGVSAAIDYPYAGAVVGISLGIVTARGADMAVKTGRLIAEIDAGILAALARRDAR